MYCMYTYVRRYLACLEGLHINLLYLTNYTLLARAYLSTSGLPEVLSYESTFEHFTLLFLSPEAQNELERHFPPPIIFSSVAEQPTLARTCIFA